MSMGTGMGKMKQAGSDLKRYWGEIQPHWRDDNQRRFESQYITPMVSRIRQTEQAMGHMANVLQRCRRDCE